jgi:hypothetical protein
MAAYRLYCMDGLGKIGRVEALEAKDDQEAVRVAYEKKLPVTCEVWDRERCLAVIPPHLEEPST